MADHTVQDMMTPSPAWVVAHDTVVDAARLMAEHECTVLPVVDDPSTRRPIGVITDWDIVSRVVARGLAPGACTVEDVMTPDPVELRLDASFQDCVSAMQQHHVRRIVVVDDRCHVIGIVTEGDLARAAQQTPELEHELAQMVGDVSMPHQSPYRGGKPSV